MKFDVEGLTKRKSTGKKLRLRLNERKNANYRCTGKEDYQRGQDARHCINHIR